MCGAKIVAPAGAKVWGTALLQVALSTAFMLAFGFPRIMIVIFGAVILLAAAFSNQMKTRRAGAPPGTPQKPVSHPVLFRILSLGVALFTFLFVAILLFGFVMFMNSWSRWQQYQGASYRRSDFQVVRVYYQRHKGGADVYASGTVEGNREWMNLLPYLHTVPHDQGELDERVPVGTSIPIYLFPDMKGRSRVQVFDEVPPAEANHRFAMIALKDGLCGLALTAGIIFLLVRLRRSCFDETAPALSVSTQEVGMGRS